MVGLLALVVNLPVAQQWWGDRRLAADGIEARAEVVETVVIGEGDDARAVVAFRMPRQVDESQRVWAVEVEGSAFDDAEASGVVEVRVVPGRPSLFEVDGEVSSRVGVLLTLAVDVLLVAFVLLWTRRREAVGPGEDQRPAHGLRPDQPGEGDRAAAVPGAGGAGAHDGERVVATGDLVPGTPGEAYQPHPDGSVELRGELVGIRDDEVVLDLGRGARVTVVLRDHRLGVRFGELAQVRALPLRGTGEA